ncbi:MULTISPECIES: DUF3413 domain-containing protein [unclassified Apibacter]|uniref:DUF3413 domain-containing protein n=1 Tax=unclassified Apibacter TaxID=2630820 RepID=UPI0013271DAD|nr:MULTISPECIES: DUF3413 domain-containing protein [unclassified Apibacter]MCX8676326.1 DUF3413 domain-containing protein [Apibacter sp. B3919]MXO23791.1 DUF3413 domain-containing protein [Apibacter sp. B3924]MXO26531.1 DUF3413 domain-containing protein [Apibacter sp. B3813]MXO28483.1 DUF3413 domain-containing protein [Apibacter sp. B3913]MXO30437.1 DUF3413 domain-containing protein [Apibacter sp. B3912]
MKINLFSKQLCLANFFNFLLVIFLGIKYLKYIENLSGFITYFYMFSSLITHFFILNCVPLLLSLLFLFFTKSKLLSKLIFSLLSILIILYLQIDILVFSQFRYHLSPIVFKLVFGKRATDIFHFSTINTTIAILYLIGLILLEILILYFSSKLSKKLPNLKIKLILEIIGFLLVGTNFIYAWADASRYRPIAQMKNIYPVFYPLTSESLFRKLNLINKQEIEKNTLLSRSYSKSLINYPLKPILSENSQKKNIIFIVIDSWRFNCMTENITPHIFELSKKSQVFQNHKSGSNMTTGGIFSLFYAIPATYYDNFTGLQVSPVFFNEILKQGYTLSILSSSTLENPPFNKNVFSGIQNLRLESNGNSPSERDKDIYNEWIKFINGYDSKENIPFFSFLFFDSAHGFDYPSDFPVKFKPTLDEVNYIALNDDYNPITFYNRYKNSLNYIDSLIGNILKKLEEKKLLDSSIVVITGDHGQEFNDNKKGYWQHGGNFSDYQIGTPLIVFDASRPAKTYTHLTLHYDIIPTLMNTVLGVTNHYYDYSVGQNLYDCKNRKWFICGYNQKYAIIEKNMIINVYSSGMYDVVDKKLNPVNENTVDFSVIKDAVIENSRFYHTSKK